MSADELRAAVEHPWLEEGRIEDGRAVLADLLERTGDDAPPELRSHALWMASTGVLPAGRTHVLSTSGMLRRAAATDARRVIVATETGLIHRLRVAQPERDFIAANEAAICRYMKMITPDKLLDSLRLNIHEVTVEPEVADRARLAIERMIAIG